MPNVTKGGWRLIWFILLVGAAAIAWFLLAPRRFSKFENIPEYVDKNLQAHTIVETTEDPREVRPIVQEQAKRVAAIPPPDHGDSRERSTPRRQS